MMVTPLNCGNGRSTCDWCAGPRISGRIWLRVKIGAGQLAGKIAEERYFHYRLRRQFVLHAEIELLRIAGGTICS